MIVSTETKIPRGMLRDAAKAGVLKNSTIAMEAATHCTVLAYGGAAVSRHTLEGKIFCITTFIFIPRTCHVMVF